MALVVEDGTGLANAESYVSVADADAYIALHSQDETWTAATEEEKEIALRTATQFMDAVYGARWKGVKNTSTQALDWPRTWVYDRNGYLYDSDVLPTKLVQALAELGIKQMTETGGLLPDYDDVTGIKKQRIKVGPIEDETEYHGSGSHTPSARKYRLVDQLLQDLLEGTNVVYRS